MSVDSNMYVKITQLECNRCHHKWYPRHLSMPKVCPKCKSPYWNKERVRKSRTKQKDLS